MTTKSQNKEAGGYWQFFYKNIDEQRMITGIEERLIIEYQKKNPKLGHSDWFKENESYSPHVIYFWNRWDSIELDNVQNKYESERWDEIGMQILIPQRLALVVLKQFHSRITGCHLGIKRSSYKVNNL